MNSFFHAYFKLRVWVILGYIVLFSLSGWYAATHLNIHTNTQDMLSEKLPWRQDYLNYQKLFPLNYRSIYLVLEGPSQEVTQQVAQQLTDSLKQDPNFHSVFSYQLTPFFKQNHLLYAQESELNALAARMPTLLPLLDLTTNDLATFMSLMTQNVKNPFAKDKMTPFYDVFLTTIENSQNGNSKPIEGTQLISDSEKKPNDLSIIEVQANIEFENTLPGEHTLELIHQHFEQLKNPWLSEVTLHLTGEIPLANEELKSVSQGAGWAALASFLMVALLLYISFRSWPLVGVSLITLILGLVITCAFAALAVGHLNMISVAFAVLYIGLSVDFTIHIILRYREALNVKANTQEALSISLLHLTPSLLLCAITTALAFYAFLPTSFKGVSELGLIAGTGMIISLFINITWLPMVLSWFKAKPTAESELLLENSFWGFPMRYPKVILSIFILLILASLVFLHKVRFNADPMSLRDPAQPSVVAFNQLLEKLPYPPNSVTVLSDSKQELDLLRETIKSLPTVKAMLSIIDFVPTNQDLKLKKLASMKAILQLKEKSGKIEETTNNRLQELQTFADALEDTPETPSNSLKQKLSDYISWLKSQPSDRQSQILDKLSQDTLFGLVYQLNDLKAGLNAQPFQEKDLPEALIQRWHQQGHYRLEVFPKGSMQDPNQREMFVQALLALAPHATGLPVIHEQAGDDVVKAFQQAFLIAFATITLLLIWVIRDLKKILLTLTPLVSACLITGGISGLMGLDFNFANVIALPLLLGIGIDNGIHLVHRFYTHYEPKDHLMHTSTSRAVVVSTLTTLFSFFNLALSNHRGMSSMGIMLTLGMLLMLLCTLVLLPALLRVINGKNKDT